jgi:hypothetical protein
MEYTPTGSENIEPKDEEQKEKEIDQKNYQFRDELEETGEDAKAKHLANYAEQLKEPEIQPQEEEEEQPGVLQELGTAIVGAGIDTVEGIGSTAEMILKGKAFDKEFTPTWLQVNDDVEPMNKTIWGKVTRGVLGFGLGFTGVGALGKVGAVSNAMKWVDSGGKALRFGKYIPGMFKTGAVKQSAVATFISSDSEGETINDAIKDIVPWWTLTATSPESTPMERKLKHVLEDIGLSGITDKLLSFRVGKAVAEAIDNGKIKPKDFNFEKAQIELKKVEDELAKMPDVDTPERRKALKTFNNLQKQIDDALSSDPEFAAAKASDEIREVQTNALNEQIQLDLFDYGLTKATPSTHPSMFSVPDQAVRGSEVNGLYQAMKDQLAIANRGDFSAGDRARIMTDAAIKRITRNNAELGKQLDAFAKEVQAGMELPAGRNVAGMGVDLTQVRQLGVAKYLDIVDTFPDVAKADWDDIEKMLLEDSIKATGVDGVSEFMNPANVMAYEMVMHDLNKAVHTKALALHTLKGQVPIDESITALMTRVEAALLTNQRSSEFAGSLLRARRGDIATRKTTAALTNVSKEDRIKEFTRSLGKIMKEDPEMTEAFLRAFSESGGDVTTIASMLRYANDSVFNWKSVVGAQGARSKFIDGMFNTLYNSILSAPKTMARAASGTGLLTVMRPLQVAMGGALAGDKKNMAKGIHMAFDNMFGTIGEAWHLASNTHKSLIDNQAGPYVNQLFSPSEQQHWKAMGRLIEKEGTDAQKAMYRLTSTLQDFNNNRWVRYPSNAMQTIDAFSKTLIGRQELKSRAFEAAWNETGGKVTKDLLKKYEDNLRNTIFNKQGEVIDITAERAGQEVALQIPLSGKLGELENLLNRTPLLRPFFLFMKTGANAISVVSKHTPLLARFNDDVRAILSATADDLSGVAVYGIRTPAELAAQKALVRGRIATGYMTVGAALGLYTTDRLTGNGPANRELRNAWIRSGKWRPRSIKFGEKWVNYDGLEPFASFLALIADIGDNAENLGEAATENMFRKAGYIISMNLTNKSFLAGLQPLQDILAFDGERGAAWAGNLVNNFAPYGGLRNEIANVLNPGLREVERDFMSTILNRNPITRGWLPLQYDPLNGDVVKNWDFPTRMWNSISPIQITGADNPTRKLLRESGYDMSKTFNTDSFGNRLSPEQKSKMMELMGKQNIEKQLDALFKDPNIKKEMDYYRKKRQQGVPGRTLDDPNVLRIEDANYFRLITNIFNNAKRAAEAELFQIYPQLPQQGYAREARKNLQGRGQSRLSEVDNYLNATRNR